MRIMVTGGAGYIGSHAVKYLSELGHYVVVVDNLSTGHKTSVDAAIPFYQTGIENVEAIKKILQQEAIDSVMHFAAFSLVKESVEQPLLYYKNNVEGTRALIEAMLASQVYKLIFSSTAAVYGEQKQQPIDETATLSPTNPYGETKRVIENMLAATANVTPLKYVSLRYFNVAGSYHDGSIGEDHNPETHLIPNLIKAVINKTATFTLYGVDHNTKDQTAIRDYIHVEDLVEAHKKALDYLVKTNQSNIFNLGTEQGYSVKEIIETTESITNTKIDVTIAERRPGDPSILIASHQKAWNQLDWKPTRDLNTMIASAYKYYKKRG